MMMNNINKEETMERTIRFETSTAKYLLDIVNIKAAVLQKVQDRFHLITENGRFEFELEEDANKALDALQAAIDKRK
jgi:hypothetical protein